MEFVSEEAAARAEPTDDELVAYMKAHPDVFAVDPRVSFRQVSLDPRKRGDALPADAKRLAEHLNAPGRAPDSGKIGDALEHIARSTGRTKSEIAREALRRQVAVARFRELRRKTLPFAEAQGLVLDEDVFRTIS